MKGNGSGAAGTPSAGTPGAGAAGEGQVDYAAEIAARDALISEADEKAQELEANIRELGDQIAERDLRIEELESALADSADALVAANAANEALTNENKTLKAQSEIDQVNYALALAGCRNVKAARAVLEDHGGDIGALKEAEPWLFAQHAAEPMGATGLPNAGAATDDGKQIRKWREIAGLPIKKCN